MALPLSSSDCGDDIAVPAERNFFYSFCLQRCVLRFEYHQYHKYSVCPQTFLNDGCASTYKMHFVCTFSLVKCNINDIGFHGILPITEV